MMTYHVSDLFRGNKAVLKKYWGRDGQGYNPGQLLGWRRLAAVHGCVGDGCGQESPGLPSHWALRGLIFWMALKRRGLY